MSELGEPSWGCLTSLPPSSSLSVQWIPGCLGPSFPGEGHCFQGLSSPEKASNTTKQGAAPGRSLEQALASEGNVGSCPPPPEASLSELPAASLWHSSEVVQTAGNAQNSLPPRLIRIAYPAQRVNSFEAEGIYSRNKDHPAQVIRLFRLWAALIRSVKALPCPYYPVD